MVVTKTTMTTDIKTYTEALNYNNFHDRFMYLRLGDKHHEDRSGYFRYLNQQFYLSDEWLKLRNHIIIRDKGGDLGFEDYPIGGRVYVHHLKPLTIDDFLNRTIYLLEPDFLITCSYNTHEQLHYGGELDVPYKMIERKPGDTKLW